MTHDDLQITTQNIKSWATRIPLKTGVKRWCSEMVGSSCSTSGSLCVKARLQDQSFPSKTWLKSKLSRLHDQILTNVSIPRYFLAINSKTHNRFWFPKDVLIGQFPSKSVKVFRKIGWVSIPSKSIKVLWQRFWCRVTPLKNFVKENFDQVVDGKNGLLHFLQTCEKSW